MGSSYAVSSLDLVRQLWGQAKLPVCVLENTLRKGNLVLVSDPAEAGQAIRSSFQLTAVAQACCAVTALAEKFRCSLDKIKERDGSREEVDQLVLEKVTVDAKHALAEFKGWAKVHISTDECTAKQEMLRASVSPDSESAREVLGIDEHAVADWDALAGLYRCRPSSSRSVPALVRIHTNFPHHKLGILQLLNLAPSTAVWNDPNIHTVFSRVSSELLQRELDKWDAFEFEAAAQERGMCVTAYRSRSEWETSEMGQALKAWMRDNDGSAFRISSLAPHPSRRRKHDRIDKSLRVIDMSRVIAGPIATRTLAAYGADVLLLSSRDLPNLPLRELETARGKRSAFINLPKLDDGVMQVKEEMKALVEEADVFAQAYRPQGLAERGLGAEAVQKIRPGIVYAELCAFGFTGPWKDKRAYDSLTQTACGINHVEGLSYKLQHGVEREEGAEKVEPRALPVQALDYTAGSLMCFGILACKCRFLMSLIGVNKEAVKEEGEAGWKVQISLASTAEWILGLGQIHGDDAWSKPPETVIPLEDEERLATMTSSYKVRGLPNDAMNGKKPNVGVLAIRHASVPADDGPARTLAAHHGGYKWAVPAHLGVDKLEWL